jgi:hypothetical protein
LSHPQTVSELYPSKWLKCADLNGRSFTLTIQTVKLEELHNPRTNKKELKAVLDFGRSKRLPLNPTQCHDLTDIAQSERFEEWPGTRITLRPGISHNGKQTIAITPAPPPETAVTDFLSDEEE